MIKIDKKERDWLVKNGVCTGNNGISRTYAHYKHYYLCESFKNLTLHDKYIAEHTIK